MASLTERIKNAWNAFRNNDRAPSYQGSGYYGDYSSRPGRSRLSRGNDRSIVTALYNRIAMDVSAITIKHVRLDETGRYKEDIDSYLNERLTLNANIDQTSRAFIQDVVMSMFDEGVVAIVPVETTASPFQGAFDILSLRTGKVTKWQPETLKVEVYNERSGHREEVVLPKRSVPVIENPFYSIMNEPNSTLQRLIRKLSLMDVVDEQSSAGKLDLIIQLPYAIKTEARLEQAEKRKAAIAQQLRDSQYGIAYIDSTEHITQLNRSLENNLMKQIEYLTSMLYSQLGMSQEILDGTADEKVMNNYQTRIIEPIISAICDGMKWKFLSKTARSQHQSIMFFLNPFKLIPVSQIGDMVDKLITVEVMTPNEFRQILGLRPSDNPEADELRNKHLNRSENDPYLPQEYYEDEYEEDESVNGDTPIEDLYDEGSNE